MKKNISGVLEIAAALIVLFSSMWNPQVSAVIAVAALVIFGVIKLISNQKKSETNIKNNDNQI